LCCYGVGDLKKGAEKIEELSSKYPGAEQKDPRIASVMNAIENFKQEREKQKEDKDIGKAKKDVEQQKSEENLFTLAEEYLKRDFHAEALENLLAVPLVFTS
jgi:hypothetical protein